MFKFGTDFGMGYIPYQPFISGTDHGKCSTSTNLTVEQEMECIKYLLRMFRERKAPTMHNHSFLGGFSLKNHRAKRAESKIVPPEINGN